MSEDHDTKILDYIPLSMFLPIKWRMWIMSQDWAGIGWALVRIACLAASAAVALWLICTVYSYIGVPEFHVRLP